MILPSDHFRSRFSEKSISKIHVRFLGRLPINERWQNSTPSPHDAHINRKQDPKWTEIKITTKIHEFCCTTLARILSSGRIVIRLIRCQVPRLGFSGVRTSSPGFVRADFFVHCGTSKRPTILMDSDRS